MLRVCVIVLAAYNCGYPGLAGVRPAFFDQPLESFHQEVNTAVAQAITGAELFGSKLAALTIASIDRTKQQLAGTGTGK
jgi:hypothetical protein